MNELPDDRIRQLIHELADAAPQPHDWDRGMPAPERSGHRNRRAGQLAAAAVLVVGLVMVTILVAGRDDSPTTTTTVAATSPTSTDPTNPTTSTNPTTTVAATSTTSGPATTTTSPPIPGDPTDVVRGYLADLAAGRFDAAADRLGAGDDWSGRSDLAGLSLVSGDGLASALAGWCDADALCQEPTSLTESPAQDGSTVVAATFELAGSPASGEFTVSAAGQVVGLPPLGGPASMAVLAAASEATTVVGRLSDDQLVTWNGDRTAELGSVSSDFVWSDGTYLMWETSSVGAGDVPTTRSTAATLDGNVVCEVDGVLHRLRERAEGGYVASVERADQMDVPTGQDDPVPNYAVDCQDGTAVAIDPVSWRREGGSRWIERIGAHTFSFDGDAEGNADVTNEAGVSVDGEDYAGYHVFSADGGLVAYGYFPPDAPSALVTDEVRGRDASTGELLWSHDFEVMFGSLHHAGKRVVVALPHDSTDPAPWTNTASVAVLDARSGELLFVLPSVIDLVHVS